MPKISVHLEADSPEEFQSLVMSFFIPTTHDSDVPPRPQDEDLARQYESIGRISRERLDSWKNEPKSDAVFPGADAVNEPAVEAEQPATEAKEPAQPRRGRPRKEKTAERAGDTAGATAGVVLPVPGDVHEDGQAEAEAAPEAKPEPVKAKPKTMPHAQPENGAATRQDLLDAFSEYVQRYGASFGFSDISSLLQKNLGDGVRKASDVPEEKLQVAIGAIKTAIADNPFNRKRDYA